jgi:hypothetical protein
VIRAPLTGLTQDRYRQDWAGGGTSGAGTGEGTQRGRAKLLPCLPANLSRHETAAELPVPVNTVSTHISSIYTKPQVNDRSSAVQHARESRLLAVARQESRTANYRAQVRATHLDGRYLERTRLLSRECAVPMTRCLSTRSARPWGPLLLLTAAVSRVRTIETVGAPGPVA